MRTRFALITFLLASFFATAQVPEVTISPTPFTTADRDAILKILEVVSQLPAGTPPAGTVPTSLPPGCSINLIGGLYCPPAPAPAPAKPKLPFATSADAYWAAQPPEVQELRKIRITNGTGSDRMPAAMALAGKGFKIDRRIMVMGWDPKASMQSWKDAGYTWIPALGQPPIEVSPGLTFPGKKPYDPANPPPGSIIVTTEFAEGYER